MSRFILSQAKIGLTIVAIFVGASAVHAADPAFGDAKSINFATKLWTALENINFVGKDRIRVKPYEGNEPHGFVLETLDTKIQIDGHTGWVIVKNNYGPEGVTVEEVEDDRNKHLDAVTVMFKREKGYDTENLDWFWAKYGADGSLDKNPKGAALAGRVAKGADVGCIACHKAAPGEDMSFTFNVN